MSIGTKILDVLIMFVLLLWGATYYVSSIENEVLIGMFGEWAPVVAFLSFMGGFGYVGGRLFSTWRG